MLLLLPTRLPAMAPMTYSQISINYSDGTPAVYPLNITKEPAADGSYEYYREVQPGEAKDILWRSKTANALVDKYAPNDKQKPQGALV